MKALVGGSWEVLVSRSCELRPSSSSRFFYDDLVSFSSGGMKILLRVFYKSLRAALVEILVTCRQQLFHDLVQVLARSTWRGWWNLCGVLARSGTDPCAKILWRSRCNPPQRGPFMYERPFGNSCMKILWALWNRSTKKVLRLQLQWCVTSSVPVPQTFLLVSGTLISNPSRCLGSLAGVIILFFLPLFFFFSSLVFFFPSPLPSSILLPLLLVLLLLFSLLFFFFFFLVIIFFFPSSLYSLFFPFISLFSSLLCFIHFSRFLVSLLSSLVFSPLYSGLLVSAPFTALPSSFWTLFSRASLQPHFERFSFQLFAIMFET